jgi:hypothetical protein
LFDCYFEKKTRINVGLFQFIFLSRAIDGGLEVLESAKSSRESMRGGCSQVEKAEHRPGLVAAVDAW